MRLHLLTLLLIAVITPIGWAQNDLAEDKKAVFCFDLDVESLLNSELAKSLGEEIIQEMDDAMQFPLPAEKYVRIFGMMGAPNSMREAMQGPGADDPKLPFNMFYQFEMVDGPSAKELLEYMDLDDGSGREIDGVTYFSPPSFAPQNIVVGIQGETTVVMGTTEFVFYKGNRKELFSGELQKAWSRHPAELPVRASLEMVSKAELISEVLAMAEQGAELPPFAAPLIGMVDNVESLNLVVDVSGQELLALRGLGKNDADAEELRGGLNGLLGMAKIMGAGAKAELAETPQAAAMVDSLMKDLSTSGEGREVNIIIGRPENFEEGLSELMVKTRAAAEVAQRRNNVREIGLASLNYEVTHLEFPFEADEAKESWRVKVAPFMFSQVKEGDMPEGFGRDGENAMVAHVRTVRLVNKIADITDGMSNTICFIEVKTGIPWKSNRDVTPDQVVEMIKNLEEDEVVVAGFYDGSVTTLNSETDLETLKAMLTPAGGEVIDR